MHYRVTRRYASSLGGPWQAGDVVDLTDAQATALNADSPGVVVVASAKADPPPAPEPAEPDEAPELTKRRGRPSRDRMARGGQDR